MENTSKLLILYLVRFLISKDNEDFSLPSESDTILKYIGTHFDDQIFNLSIESMRLNIESKYLDNVSVESDLVRNYVADALDNIEVTKKLVIQIYDKLTNEQNKDED